MTQPVCMLLLQADGFSQTASFRQQVDNIGFGFRLLLVVEISVQSFARVMVFLELLESKIYRFRCTLIRFSA